MVRERATVGCSSVRWVMNHSEVLSDLKAPHRNQLEKLEDDPKGQHSIRINDQFRVCFRWTERGPEGAEIVDDH